MNRNRQNEAIQTESVNEVNVEEIEFEHECIPTLLEDTLQEENSDEGQLAPEKTDENPLSASERQEWSEKRDLVIRGSKTFIEVGLALKEIRDKKLYREEFRTFEAFCRAIAGKSKTQANRQISAAEAYRQIEMAPVGVSEAQQFGQVLPMNEAQLRPLTRLKDPAEKQKAWSLAIGRSKGKAVTADEVEKAVLEIAPRPPTRPVSRSTKTGKQPPQNPDQPTRMEINLQAERMPQPISAPEIGGELLKDILEEIVLNLKSAIEDKDWDLVEGIAEELVEVLAAVSNDSDQTPYNEQLNLLNE